MARFVFTVRFKVGKDENAKNDLSVDAGRDKMPLFFCLDFTQYDFLPLFLPWPGSIPVKLRRILPALLSFDEWSAR